MPTRGVSVASHETAAAASTAPAGKPPIWWPWIVGDPRLACRGWRLTQRDRRLPGGSMTATQNEITELRDTIGTLQVRLDAALTQRNSDYDERVKHQAATIDVLRAMSASPADPQPVFDLITTRARELCGSVASMLF